MVIHDELIELNSEYIKIEKRNTDWPTLISFSNAGVPKGKFKPFKAFQNVKANIIFLNDKNYRWYLEGIDGLTDDCESSAKKLVEIAKTIGNGKVYTFGSSMGAFGATLYAMLGEADGCLAVALESRIGYEGSRSSRSQHLNAHKSQLKYTDLSTLIEEKKVPLTLFVPENDEVDLLGAYYILNLPNVRVISIQGAEHPGLQVFTSEDKEDMTLEQLINEYTSCGGIVSDYRRKGNIFNTPDAIIDVYNAFLKKSSSTKQEWLQNLIELSKKWPDIPLISLRAGEAFYANSNPNEAEKHWRHVLHLSEFQYEACAKLGALLRRKGQYDEARVLIQKSTVINPLYSYGYANLGLVYFDLKDYNSAEKYVRDAIKINPENVYFKKHLANILMESAQQKIAEANTIYQNLTK